MRAYRKYPIGAAHVPGYYAENSRCHLSNAQIIISIIPRTLIRASQSLSRDPDSSAVAKLCRHD